MKNTSYAIAVIALIAALFLSIAYVGSVSMTLALLIIGLVFVLAVGFVLGLSAKQI